MGRPRRLARHSARSVVSCPPTPNIAVQKSPTNAAVQPSKCDFTEEIPQSPAYDAVSPLSIRECHPLTSSSEITEIGHTRTDLEELATAYQIHVHPFAPVLPADYNELLEVIKIAKPLLLSAMHCITFPNVGALPLPSISPNLEDIQAALLLTHAHYGRGDTESARAMLQQASQCLLDLSPTLIADSIQAKVAPEDLKSFSRVWWECWSLEIMLAAVTGVRTFLLADAVLDMPILPEAYEERFDSNQVCFLFKCCCKSF